MKKEIKLYIDKITDTDLQGWFINTPEPENNKLLLFLDGQYKAVTLANKERQDVADEYGQLHSGFFFDISRYPNFKNIELKLTHKETLLSAEIKRDKSKALPEAKLSPYSKLHHERLETLNIDLSKTINGDNWYAVEPTGRWGGPERISTLTIPALNAGRYLLELDISSEFCGLENMQLRFNETDVTFLNTSYQTPVVLQAKVQADKLDYWTLVFHYPKTSAPEGESGADQRQLGIFLKNITFTKLDS